MRKFNVNNFHKVEWFQLFLPNIKLVTMSYKLFDNLFYLFGCIYVNKYRIYYCKYIYILRSFNKF